MRSWAAELAEALARGPVVMATVIWTRGSVPREVGAKLLIDAQEQIWGTIGGGAGEHKVCQGAAAVMASGHPCWVEIDLRGSIQDRSFGTREGICGGQMGVWLSRWQGESAHALATQIQACCAPITSGGGCGSVDPPPPQVLVMPLSSDPPFLRPAHPADPERWVTQESYQERLLPLPVLLIVGAGHVGAALAQVASLTGFEVIVCDDRPDWGTQARFPQARVEVGPLGESLARLGLVADRPLSRPLYGVLVTRGYSQDLEALQRVLPLYPDYLGLIGSRRRVRSVLQRLREQAEGPVERGLVQVPLYGPIGLDIGALTPAEIAISILAEIIQHRRGGTGGSLSRGDQEQG